jgi:phosphoesterase RecJ-like protein
MLNEMPELKPRILAAKNIVITCHVSPDGDAIGSSLGLYHFLKGQNLNASVVVPNAFPKFLSWLSASDSIVLYDQQVEEATALIKDADVIFCLDYNETRRTAQMQEAIDASQAYKVLIDHHIGEPTWPDVNLSVVGASSTCELVLDFIKAFEDKEQTLPTELAYCLYTGLLTDTGNFQYSATTPKVHIQAAELIAAGVEPDLVHNHINNSYDEQRLQFFGFCISKRMKILKEKKIAYMPLSQKDMHHYNVQTGGTEGLVNEPMKIAGIDISILLKEDDGKVKMSFRSKRDIDISVFARTYFKGGGHRNAAGGISFKGLEATEKDLLMHFSNFNIS